MSQAACQATAGVARAKQNLDLKLLYDAQPRLRLRCGGAKPSTQPCSASSSARTQGRGCKRNSHSGMAAAACRSRFTSRPASSPLGAGWLPGSQRGAVPTRPRHQSPITNHQDDQQEQAGAQTRHEAPYKCAKFRRVCERAYPPACAALRPPATPCGCSCSPAARSACLRTRCGRGPSRSSARRFPARWRAFARPAARPGRAA